MKRKKLKIASLLAGLVLTTFNGYSQDQYDYWTQDIGTGVIYNNNSAGVEITSGPLNCNAFAITCGAITASGNISCGTHALTAGGVTCGAITSSGNFSNGSNTLGCGAITSTGNFSNGTHAVTCGGITSSGNFSNGSNTLGCGAITSTGNFSNGSNTLGCGAITSTGNFSNGSNTLGCGAITSGAITSSGNITSTGNVGIGTSSPTALLDVTGTTTSDTKVNFLNTSTGSVGLELRGTAGSQYIDFEDASTSNTGSGTPDYRNRIISSSTSFQIIPNGSNGITMLNAGSVGIGTGTSLTAQTQFDVLYNTGSAFTAGPVYGGHFLNSNTISGATTPYVYGAYAAANGTESNTSAYHYGVSASATNAYNCVGVSGVASGISGGTRAYGGYFNASFSSSGSLAYGVYATASGAGDNYALYATVPSYANGNYAAYLNGDVYTNGGTNSGTGWLTASDQQFKTNIKAVLKPSDILNKLKPKSYYYDTTANNGMHFSGKKQYGFIAQELQQVLPELVYNVKKPADYDKDGKVTHAAISHLAVNYDGFIALLIASMQEQQAKNDKQDSIIAAMQKQLNQLLGNNGEQNNIPSNSTTSINTISTQLSDADVVVLNQNQPNPFAEQTLITYNIPQNANAAQILFYDINGKQIKSQNITTKGKGALNVYANDLSSGTYSYTLIVDGKVIDTKKMIKQ